MREIPDVCQNMGPLDSQSLRAGGWNVTYVGETTAVDFDRDHNRVHLAVRSVKIASTGSVTKSVTASTKDA